MGDAPPAVVSAIGAADTIAVVGHVGPDGDALGSMLALARAARAAGKSAWATFGDPFVVPHQLGFLDMTPLVRTRDIPERLDVLVVVDCGDRDRLGNAGVLVDRADKVVVVDHHKSNEGFGDVAWVDPTAGATAQMIYRVITALGWDVDASTAEALYTGIVTDTGRFQYSNTSPEVHHIAAALLDAGVLPDAIGQQIYERSPFGYLGLAGTVMQRAQFDAERKLVWSTLTQADLEDAGIGYEAADGLIDLIRVAEEAEVACLLREVGDNRTKGSLRSRGTVDVSVVAVSLGGGGHHNAAGFTIEADLDTTFRKVLEALG